MNVSRITSIALAASMVFSMASSAQHALGEHGTVDFEVSCANGASAPFQTGLALLHHMMYEEAEAAFREAAAADDACAIAHWGIAMTQLHPLWSPPTEAELIKGQDAARTAKALDAPTERERLYIDAIAAFFETDGDFPTRLQAWHPAQEKVYKAHPDDVDAAAFHALAQLATAPKEDMRFERQEKAGALLESLLYRAPNHPGLFHYTIHAYDNPALADKAVSVARGYDKLAPEVPHALHMPSHIFVRKGLWEDVVEWNRRSADAALKHPSGDMTAMHYAHAMDYLAYANLQMGRDEDAAAAIAELQEKTNMQRHLGSAYALAAAPARYALERRNWEEAAELGVWEADSFPWERYPAAVSMTHFARGLGAARMGDLEAAGAAIGELDRLYDELESDAYWKVHTDAQRKAVAAWVAHAEGDKDRALELMRSAADIEDSVDKHPITPSAVLPARELLGEMLLMEGRSHEALQAFEQSLAVSPNRLNSVSGAGRAAELAGDRDQAASYYGDVVALIGRTMDVERPRAAEARNLVADR